MHLATKIWNQFNYTNKTSYLIYLQSYSTSLAVITGSKKIWMQITKYIQFPQSNQRLVWLGGTGKTGQGTIQLILLVATILSPLRIKRRQKKILLLTQQISWYEDAPNNTNRFRNTSWTPSIFFLEHVGELCIFVLRGKRGGWSNYNRQHVTLDQNEGCKLSRLLQRRA